MIVAGKKSRKKYEVASLAEIVGKTVEAVERSTIDSEYGEEPLVSLYFTDGTTHGFVLPREED